HRLREIEIAAERVAGEQPALDPPAVAFHRILRQEAVLEEAGLLQVGGERLGVALLGQPFPLQPQAALDERQQHPAVERLEEEVERPLLQRAEELLVRLRDRAGDQDDVRLRPVEPDHLAQRVAVAVLEAHVHQGEIEFALREARQGLADARHRLHRIRRREDALQRPPQTGIVVDDEDALRPHGAASSPSSPANCSSTTTRVPSPGTLSISKPPPFCHASERQMARPSPTPPCLVEKNGSCTWSNRSERMPGPSSATARKAVPSCCRVEMTTRLPFSAIASSELLTRLSTMCCRSLREKRMGGSSSLRSSTVSMPRRAAWPWKNGTVSRTTWLTSTVRSPVRSARATRSMLPKMRLHSRAFSTISSRSRPSNSVSASPCLRSSRICCASGRMVPTALLTSWATALASVTRVAFISAWIACRSSDMLSRALRMDTAAAGRKRSTTPTSRRSKGRRFQAAILSSPRNSPPKNSGAQSRLAGAGMPCLRW